MLGRRGRIGRKRRRVGNLKREEIDRQMQELRNPLVDGLRGSWSVLLRKEATEVGLSESKNM
jgi:hypothetical protein